VTDEHATDLDTMRVAAVQMAPAFADVPANVRAILGWIGRAAEAGAQLVVFPECALTGYGFDTREEAMSHAEPIPGPALLPITFECGRLGVYAIVGMLERDGDRLYNACALVGRGGVLGTYRKVHLPFMGVDRVADPGDRAFGVYEAAGVRVGMHICYDGAFPETGRVLSLLGADLLALPTNWPPSADCAADHLMATRAMENHVYAMAVNRVGEERGVKFIGKSSIHAPGGACLARAGGEAEELLLADVTPSLARQKRQVRVPGLHEIDRIGDRRPRFYGPIGQPNGRL
jgi:predicted amidohydrolase